jgi:AraC-like DNA-binding protein
MSAPMNMDLRIETSLPTRERAETQPAIVLPLERSVVELVAGGEHHRLDRSSFAIVQAGTRHRLEGISPVSRTAKLLVGDAAVARAVKEYRPHVDAERFRTVLASGVLVVVRTRWFDEIVHRYVFERDVCEKHTSAAARFLETEIAKEVFFLGREQLEERLRASVVYEGSDVVARARAFIEENLFTPFRIDELARHCGTSESTLLRAFRREVGTTPLTFCRDRRLDEALLLLQAGRFSVGEVSAQIGYGNLSAFTVAFRRRFKIAPSHVKRAPAQTLAPHGDPPKRRANRRAGRRAS